jgi:serine/threonine protein kinase/Tfp pilus assembly protein PilF
MSEKAELHIQAGLLDRLIHDMIAAWARGERPLAEDFLAQHPGLSDDPTAVADLIYEEVCLREQYGESISTAALLRRFPQWRAQLAALLDCQRLFEPSPPPQFPSAGERFGEFQLLAELGRGGGGVVFLATQPALAERPVVLKLTRRTGSEHLRLARLQHTHIVPLYAAHDDPDRGLRSLCMPYFGGTSLSRLLAALEQRPPGQRSGKDLLDALDQFQNALPLAVPAHSSSRDFLQRASYVRAICFLGRCLASALHYAHEHGVVHLDLKPANVLLTADGQPMLLDFHLAHEPLLAGATVVEGVGGTPEYMSPEQQRALAAVCAGQPVPAAVDARSDIYSLGVLLYRALGGSLPLPDRASQRLRRTNPTVSPGLADILARCLQAEPHERYPDADALASDLQRHLHHQPLRGVPNRNLLERWHKWRRRKPYALHVSLILLIVPVLALGGAWAYYQPLLDEAHTALTEGTAYLHEGRHDAAVRTLERGVRLAENVPFHAELAGLLREEWRQAEALRANAEQAQIARELHQLADRVRLLIGNDALPPAARPGLEAACRAFWERRSELLQRLAGDSPAHAGTVRQDLLDLALFWTDLRVALGTDLKTLLRTLDEVESVFGPSPVLYQYRQRHAAAAGLQELASTAARRQAEMAPRSAWEHVALGRSLLAADKPRQAAAHFESALRMEPTNLWPSFYQGLCYSRLGQHKDAIVPFSICIGLAPRSAQCYFNRGCAYAGCNEYAAALLDFNRSLEFEPTLAVAYLNRGRVYVRTKQPDQALADLQRALVEGANPSAVHHDMALAHLVRGARGAALASLRAALAHDPSHAASRTLLADLENRP